MWHLDKEYKGNWIYDKVFNSEDLNERLRIVQYPGKGNSVWAFYVKKTAETRLHPDQQEKLWKFEETNHQFDCLEDAHKYYSVSFDENDVRYKSIKDLFMLEDQAKD